MRATPLLVLLVLSRTLAVGADGTADVVAQARMLAGDRGGWVLLMLANAAYMELTRNWICNLKSLGLEHLVHSTLFVALDEPTYAQLEGYHRVPWFIAGEEPLEYGTPPYYDLMHRRTALVLELLRHDIRVFLCEADQAWAGDVVQYVDERHAGADIVTYDDSINQRGRLPCGGFLFLNPSPATLQLWQTLTERHAVEGGNEQLLLRQILFEKPRQARVHFLPAHKFRNGRPLQGKGPPMAAGTLFVHANWMVGTLTKAASLRENALWYAGENDTCLHEQVSAAN